MFCRCRYLRAFHLGSLLSPASSSIPTRRALRVAAPSRASSQSPTNSSPSHHDESIPQNKDSDTLDVDSLLGSARSPLAFKPFPLVADGASLSYRETKLSPDLEAEKSRSITTHTEDPSLRVPATGTLLPWVVYVKQLKCEKRRRQLNKARSFRDPTCAIREWDHIRTWNRVQIANVSVLQWTLLAEAGCLLSDPSVLYHLSAELVDAHANSPRAQISMVFRVLRGLILTYNGGIAKHTMFDPLLRFWKFRLKEVSEAEASFHKNLDYLLMDLFSEFYQDKPEFVDQLPRNMIFSLVASAAYRCPPVLKHGGLLNAFFAATRRGGPKLFLSFPLRDPAPRNIAPTGHVWALLRLIQVYINSESSQEAFRLFQRLVREKMITSSAISQVNINGKDPRTTVLFAMTKTCLDYEWNTGALELMILAAEHDPTIFDEQMKSLVNETLHLLLNQAASMSPAHKYHMKMSADVLRKSERRLPDGPKFLLRRIVALIAALRQDHGVFEIEDKVIQGFYIAARRLEYHEAAEALFGIGRVFIPPSFSTPSLLVSPSFVISNNPETGYLLPVQPRHFALKPTSPPTPPSNILQSTIVSKSALEPLDTANTQYPAPRGPPLLWLLENMLKHTKNIHLSRCLAKEVVGSNIDIPVYDRGHFVRFLASAGFALTARELWKRYSKDETQGVIGHAGAMTRLVNLFYHLGNELEAKEAALPISSPDPDELLDDDDDSDIGVKTIDGDDAKILFDAVAARSFANEVVEKFRACKEPIQAASQFDINALARLYFMMDKPEEGFALFQMVKGTRSPDMHDVNVGLLGIAKYNMELASKMVDRMHRRGLVPDAVTWGTLIHLAFLKEDISMVVSFVKRAQERGTPKFSDRTIGSLIRASLFDVPSGSQVPSHTVTLGKKRGVGPLRLTFGGEGSASQIGQNLGTAWHLIGTLDPHRFVGVWSLAKFCLDRALWLGDAELAFGFWNKYLRSKTEWNDFAQVEIRKKIFELVEEQQKLGAVQTTRMLPALSGTLEPDEIVLV